MLHAFLLEIARLAKGPSRGKTRKRPTRYSSGVVTSAHWPRAAFFGGQSMHLDWPLSRSGAAAVTAAVPRRYPSVTVRTSFLSALAKSARLLVPPYSSLFFLLSCSSSPSCRRHSNYAGTRALGESPKRPRVTATMFLAESRGARGFSFFAKKSGEKSEGGGRSSREGNSFSFSFSSLGAADYNC